MHVSISKNVTRRARGTWKKRGMEDDQQSQRSHFMQMLHSRLISLLLAMGSTASQNHDPVSPKILQWFVSSFQL